MPEADELVEALGDVFERQRADDEADDDRTFRALVSQRMDAVEQQLRHVVGGLGQVVEGEDGYSLSLGTARMVFLSAEPESNVVGHTADMILEVDEAQDVDIEKFDKEFRPMAASTAATTVYYGPGRG